MPIVTENQAHIQKFYKHVLSVRFEAPSHLEDIANQKAKTFVILRKDLPDFCRFLQWLFYSVPSTATLITHLRDTPAHMIHVVDDPTAVKSNCGVPSIRLEFGNVGTHQLNPQVAQSLLDPFRNVIIGKQDVETLPAVTLSPQTIQEMKRKMGPKSVWLNAMAWNVIETLREFNQKAEDLIEQRDLVRASVWYTHIMGLYANCSLFHLADSAYNSDIARPINIIDNLLITAAITDSFVKIRLGTLDWESAKLRMDLVHVLMQHTGKLPMPERIQNTLSTIAVWFDVLCRFLTQRNTRTLEMSLRSMRSLKGSSLADDEHFQHDLNLIEQYATNNEVPPSCHSILA